jgi:hypothetical protein
MPVKTIGCPNRYTHHAHQSFRIVWQHLAVQNVDHIINLWWKGKGQQNLINASRHVFQKKVIKPVIDCKTAVVD